MAGHNGLQITASTTGPKTGFPVMLAHGGGQTRHAWVKVLDELANAGYRATAIDMRGHGDSEWASDGAYDMRDFARDLVAISKQLSNPPALVGASLGGIAGMIAAGELAPAGFRSLTLVDIAPKMEAVGVSRVVGFMQAHMTDGFSSPEEAAKIIAEYMPQREKRTGTGKLDRYLRKRENGRYYWHWDPNFIHHVTHARDNAAEAKENGFDRLSAAAARLTLPVHLIRGGSSDMVSEEAVAHFQTLVPSALLTDIADASHMVVGDRNDAFCSAIISFLNATHNRGAAA
ncbi:MULTISPECIES: alpha/beta fold hydrolase [unclassified Sphingorhabdus]|uniref:alpha/beta fold hydrolase n=1 Tax=unclassified Sphingorhabdus TaxID=2614947 RepID=UPI001F3E8573|nr:MULTISPECIES: alpha/beta hydrolase [unclassified Sphingorhabdus]